MSEQNQPDEQSARLQNEVEQAKHKAQMRGQWQSLMDELITEGQEKGLFDDLDGKGKPLALDKNHFAAEMDLAHSLLKENDLPPAWIGERGDILARIKTLREHITRQWGWHQREMAQTVGDRGHLTLSWDNYLQRWRQEIADLNRRIERYNLKRPLGNMEIFKLKLEEELQRVDAPRWLR